MGYMQALSPGNENNSTAEVAVATVAIEFQAPQTEGDPSHSSWTLIRTAKSKTSRMSTDAPIPPRQYHPPASSNPGGYQGMSSPNFHLNDLAYTKVICHALKYPNDTVNGLLLGHHPATDAPINIVDVVPLQHHDHRTNLDRMINVGFIMVSPSFRIFYSSL